MKTAAIGSRRLSQPPAIKRFVRETLGCTCPEQVFDRVRIDAGPGLRGRPTCSLTVGDRLLIVVIDTSAVDDLAGAVTTALAEGARERDRQGLNRFRLVLAATDPTEVEHRVEAAFAASPARDDRTHLHVVPVDVDDLLSAD